MAEADTSIVLASSVMAPMPAPTATIARPIGTMAATMVPNTTSRTSSATRSPIPAWPVSSSALRNTASPPSSTCSPGTSTPETAFESTVNAGLPSSRCGASRVISAYPIRPSAEIVPAANGSLTDATWSRVATSVRTASTSARWLSSVLAVLGREDDQGLALGRLGEALVEQVEGARALAVGDAEVAR